MPVLAQFTVTTPVIEEAVENIRGSTIEYQGYSVFETRELGLRYWIPFSEREEFEKGLESDETVIDYEALTEEGPRCLYQIRLSNLGWKDSFVPLLGETGGELTDVERVDGHWLLLFRFPSNSAYREFVTTYQSRSEISMDLDRIIHESSYDDTEFDLTPSQRETLNTAIEQGYFKIPRKVTLQGLADELGVSDQAVSERLRRAQQRVFERIL